MPIAVHLLSSDDYEFTADDERKIVSEARRTEPAVRTLLPGLRECRDTPQVVTGVDVQGDSHVLIEMCWSTGVKPTFR